MQYLDQSTYAIREFYARNAHLAPTPKPRWKRVVVLGVLVLFGTGAATGAYVLSTELNRRGVSPESFTHAHWVENVKSFVVSLTSGR